MQEIPTSYPVKVPIQTRFCDTDASGHINNVSYMAYFELGRANYFKALRGHYNRDGSGFILGSIQAKFLKQAFFGSDLQIEAGISGIGRSSFRISCRIIDTATGEKIAESDATIVSYDFSAGHSVPLSDEWKKRVAEVEGIEPDELLSSSVDAKSGSESGL